MKTIELIIIAVGVSMDAFAVAICKGLSMSKMSYKSAIITGCFFGGFQGIMPFIGYILGSQFKDYIVAIDHWIAFVLLSAIGINMIKEAKHEHCPVDHYSFCFKSMLILAVATSIDALAIGITLAVLDVNIVTSVITIGIITFIFSFIGVRIGNILGAKWKSKAELVGGSILIAMGAKILLEHLGII